MPAEEATTLLQKAVAASRRSAKEDQKDPIDFQQVCARMMGALLTYQVNSRDLLRSIQGDLETIHKDVATLKEIAYRKQGNDEIITVN